MLSRFALTVRRLACRAVVFAAALTLAAGLAFAQQAQPAQQPQPAQQQQQDQQAQPPQQVQAIPQAPEVPEAGKAARAYEQLRGELDKIRKDIAVPTITPEELGQKRQAAEKIRADALAAQADLRKPLDDVDAQLTKLGKPPGKGESEAPAVAAERKRLNDAVEKLQGSSKQLGVLAVDADQAAASAANLQRDQFIRRIFEPSRSVLNPLLWYGGFSTVGAFAQRAGIFVKTALVPGVNAERTLSPTMGLTLASAIALLCIIIAWRVNLRFMRRSAIAQPDHLQRLWRAVWATVATVAVLIAGVLIAQLVIKLTGGVNMRFERVMLAFERGLVSFGIKVALAVGILAPRNPGWRLVNVSDQTAGKMTGVITILAFVFSLAHVVSTMANTLFLPIEFTVGWSAGIAIAYIVLIAALLRLSRSGGEAVADGGTARHYYFGWTAYVFHLLWGVVLMAAVALLFGYVALAHYLLQKLIETSVVITMLYLLHHLMDAGMEASLDPRTLPGRFLRSSLSLGEAGTRRIGLVLSTIVDVGLVLVGVPLVLALWALTWIDYSSWLQTIFYGFKVGDITIQPDAILLGLGIFLVGLIGARLFTLWLERRVLAHTKMDAGLRNSVLTGANYAAILLVAAIGVSAAGVNFSNLAIIAGALSVGIGFGLQSIVNNFVSGLILLAERPIQVGDWIAVSGGEGYVKKINVRSTEIETFDRGSVIIPNSTLISESVLNWTHTDAIGRARIAVGVSYNADPEKVEQVLLECARANKRVLSYPQPYVVFRDFGASSLDFELRVYIPDVNYVLTVGSELRFAIFKALKDAGIEIPFPQRDVHVKSMPGPMPPPPPEAPARKRKT